MWVSIVSRSVRLLNRDAGVRKVFLKHAGPRRFHAVGLFD
jgi:hypothetical protein